MSIENDRTRKSNPWSGGEDRWEETEQSSLFLQRSGGVGVDSMLGRETEENRETCIREDKTSTRGTTSHKKKALSASVGVGVLCSSDEF